MRGLFFLSCRAWVGAVVLLAGLAGPLCARAGALRAEELLPEITARRVPVESLEAVYASGAPGGSGPEETVFFRAPDRVRVNVVFLDRREVFLAVGRQTLSLAGARAVDKPWPQPYVLFRLLLAWEAAELRELLSGEGFDLERAGLGRSGEGVVYILGAREGELNRTQAWFERESLRLRRLILAPGPGRPGYDVILSGYRRQRGLVDWPERLVTRVGLGGPQEVVLSSLRLSLGPAEGPLAGEETAGPADPDLVEIRQMMDWFRKKLQ